MYIVISTSLIAVLLAFLSKYKSFSKGLEVGFAIVTFIGCIHYNYGNDYEVYYYLWNTISQLSLNELFTTEIHTEPGWRIINWLFKFENGFFALVAILNIIQNYIYYRVIKTIVPRNWWWLSMFVYLCTTTNYPLFFSMMRQGLAISLILASFLYLRKKKVMPTLGLIILASTFHSSALITLPIVLLNYSKYKRIPVFALIILFLTFIVYVFKDIIDFVMKAFLSMSIFETYSTYTAGESVSLGLGFLLRIVPYLVSLYFLIAREQELSIEEKQITLISYVAFLFFPLATMGVTLVERIGYYFSIFQIVTIPLLYRKIKIKPIRNGLIFVLIYITWIMYYAFFQSEVWKDTMMDFHTIFEVL